MLIKRKLLIEYRKLLIKNVKLDNRLKRRQIMINTLDLWRFQELQNQIEENEDADQQYKEKIHI